jgi:hypothetical protein
MRVDGFDFIYGVYVLVYVSQNIIEYGEAVEKQQGGQRNGDMEDIAPVVAEDYI